METTADPIQASKYRTYKEVFYFGLFVLMAIGLWSWLVYGLFHPETTNPQETKEAAEQSAKFWRELLSPGNILFYIGLSFFSHLLSMAYIRLNAIRVGPNQFPEIWETVESNARRLEMSKAPATFILNGDGVINAFAARLVFRKIMVLYSDLVNTLLEDKDPKQLEAVIAHELGHHALGHTGLKEWLFLPLEFVPFLGSALSRARERSADQVMKALMNDPHVCQRALVKLAAGKKLGGNVNIAAYLEQEYEERGFFSWLAEKLASHPHLPTRIAAMGS